MGPATGGATTVGQGDVQFLRWGTSGGYPIIVLCPATAADCYALALRAFDLAERFRCPVFIAADKEVATTMDTVEISPRGTWDDPTPLSVRPREVAPPECAYRPCDYLAIDRNVPLSPFGGPHLLRFTTSTHDEDGYITRDPVRVERLNRHLLAKIEAHRHELELVRSDPQSGAEVLLLSYGVTARAVDEAVHMARAGGSAVSSLTLLSLWPVPEVALTTPRLWRGVRRVVVAELNAGQMRREVERVVGSEREVIGMHRLDGELITPRQILEAGGLL